MHLSLFGDGHKIIQELNHMILHGLNSILKNQDIEKINISSKIKWKI